MAIQIDIEKEKKNAALTFKRAFEEQYIDVISEGRYFVPKHSTHSPDGVYTILRETDDLESLELDRSEPDTGKLGPDSEDRLGTFSEAQSYLRKVQDKLVESGTSWIHQNNFDIEGELRNDKFKSVHLDKVVDYWPVGHQLLTASCVGWTMAGILEYHGHRMRHLGRYAIDWRSPLTLDLTAQSPHSTLQNIVIEDRLSPRFFWTMAKEYDGRVRLSGVMDDRCGTRMECAMKALKKTPLIAFESQVPFAFHTLFPFYHSDSLITLTHRPNFLVARNIFKLFDCEKASQPTCMATCDDWNKLHDLIQDWILWMGPLAIEFDSEWTYRKIGIDSQNGADPCIVLDQRVHDRVSEEGSSIENDELETYNHAVLLTGYSRSEESGKVIYRFKNSYGAQWGDQGYFEMTKAYFESSVISVMCIGDYDID